MAQKIFERGGLYTDLRGGGRGLTAQLDQVRAGIKQRPDIFIAKGKNVGKTKLAEGYSFKPGKGMTLVDTISYRGNETYSDGVFNVYGPAAQSVAPPDDGGGGDDDGGSGGNTTGPVDPIGPVTGGDGSTVDGGGTSGPSIQDLIDAITNMPQPTINIPPPPVYTPPPSFAAVGQAASANPGVRIRRSRSRAQGTNTLGTNFFNRGTRNTLRISGLNV
uniref:Uncharacterized protein n=1 Tax=uncultured cyanophage TaxID=215796 RepID=Q6SL69_9VIRU|nr:unknown [uncultured cyanophage]